MATFLRPLGIVLRNHLSMHYLKSLSCKETLMLTHQSLCPDHLKKEIHSLCIKSRKDLKVEDLTRPACGYILFSRRLAHNGVDANNLTASTEVAEFEAVLPELVEDLTKNEIKNPEIADACIWLKEAGISDEESHTKASTIFFEMGHVYQVQSGRQTTSDEFTPAPGSIDVIMNND